ncbi:MAG: hypothetical protein IGS39_21585 [Calothrix sp. C42_A2020_038]|nr:hypothetical protein [Calothrix sp. C42_A2020_038]
MRTVISLLVTTLFLSSLVLEFQNSSQFKSDMNLILASRTKPGSKPKKPEQPIPHRGSGRRNLMEYFVGNSPAV